MVFFNSRTIIIRTRRALEVLSVLTFFTIIFLFSSRSPNLRPPAVTPIVNKATTNPFDALDHGRPDLPKFIHLDLKGAPPRPKEFYEKFFRFLNQIDMGVKGLVIEYEDMLPLHGNLINVSEKDNLDVV